MSYLKTTTCMQCGNDFEHNRHIKRMFCSHACRADVTRMKPRDASVVQKGIETKKYNTPFERRIEAIRLEKYKELHGEKGLWYEQK